MAEIQDITDMDPVLAATMKPDSLPAPLMMMGSPQDEIIPRSRPAPLSLTDPLADDDDLDDDLDIDETLAERLWGLTEMFPEPLVNFTSAVVSKTWNGSCTLYSLGKSATWVIASSAAILALPVMFETERAQMEEQQIQQQRQILLGPNAAVSGGGAAPGPGGMPQVVPPGAR